MPPPEVGSSIGPISLHNVIESRKSVFRRLLLRTGGSEGERKVKSADRVEFAATIIPKGQVRKPLPLWDDIDEQ